MRILLHRSKKEFATKFAIKGIGSEKSFHFLVFFGDFAMLFDEGILRRRNALLESISGS